MAHTSLSIRDHRMMRAEGWGIFQTGDHEGSSRAKSRVDGKEYGARPFELQKVDESDRFHQDHDAWQYVVDKAKQGSGLHIKALRFLREQSPHEFHAIQVKCGQVNLEREDE